MKLHSFHLMLKSNVKRQIDDQEINMQFNKIINLNMKIKTSIDNFNYPLKDDKQKETKPKVDLKNYKRENQFLIQLKKKIIQK